MDAQCREALRELADARKDKSIGLTDEEFAEQRASILEEARVRLRAGREGGIIMGGGTGGAGGAGEGGGAGTGTTHGVSRQVEDEEDGEEEEGEEGEERARKRRRRKGLKKFKSLSPPVVFQSYEAGEAWMRDEDERDNRYVLAFKSITCF